MKIDEHLRLTESELKNWLIAQCQDSLAVGAMWYIGLRMLGVPPAPLWAGLAGVCIQNRTPPETEFARKSKERGCNETVFTLQPGKPSLKKCSLSASFTTSADPAKYTIQVSRAVPRELGGGTVQSNTIKITITD